MPMDPSTLVIWLMIKGMEKEYIYLILKIFMLGTGAKTACTDMVVTFFGRAKCTKGSYVKA